MCVCPTHIQNDVSVVTVDNVRVVKITVTGEVIRDRGRSKDVARGTAKGRYLK